MGTFDSQQLPIECPNCSRKLSKTVAWIKTHNEIACPCGATIKLQRDKLLSGIRQAENALSRLKKTTMKFKL